jgi:hypothetical protein
MGVLRDSGSTNFNLPRIRQAERPRDALLEAVQDAAAGEYEVFGEICRGKGGTIAYLARDLADKKLVVLRLSTSAGAGDEYSLEVVKQLDASVPAPEGACPSCGAPLRQWGRFCSMCGCDLWGDPSVGGENTKEDLLQAVKEAAKGKFEVLGEMPWAEGSGHVYFVRDLESGKLAALRLLEEAEGEYSLGRTGVLKRLAEDVKPVTPSAPRPPTPKPTPRTPSLEPVPLGPPPTEPAPLDSFAARSAPIGKPRATMPHQGPDRHLGTPRGPAHYDRWEQALEFLMQPLVLAIIAVAAVVVLVALCVVITPGSGGTARLDSPSDLATPEAGEAVVLASKRPEESALGYSVAIASYRTLDEALARQRELAGLEGTLYVSPTVVRGTVYYRLLCGLLPHREQAEALVSRLVESGVKDVAREWDVRPSGLAFHFGTYDSRNAADQAVGRLLRQGIPTYKVAVTSAADTAAYHVYAGGYESPEEARQLQEQIARAGLEAELVERRGSVHQGGD